jgi:hypothetical protein
MELAYGSDVAQVSFSKLCGLEPTYKCTYDWSTRETKGQGPTPAPIQLGRFELGKQAGQKFSNLYH